MEIVCAWCGRELTHSEGEEAPSCGLLRSHGICEDCLESLVSGGGQPLQEFLDSLGFPVTVVSGNVEVLAANHSARILAGKNGDDVVGRLLGEVFECVHSRLPGGCGRTIHCSGCAIRRTTTDTYLTGRAHRRVPATFTFGPEEVALTHDFFLSTEKVGQRVLLVIELPDEEPD